MNAATEMESPLIFTDSAASKVKSLIDEEGNPDLKLRVFVTGGGCSGFQYGFTFDEDAECRRHRDGEERRDSAGRSDELPVSGGCRDRLSEGLEGAQFVIKNPNATTTCGCGSSFSA